jgi:hypothetical protein
MKQMGSDQESFYNERKTEGAAALTSVMLHGDAVVQETESHYGCAPNKSALVPKGGLVP